MIEPTKGHEEGEGAQKSDGWSIDELIGRENELDTSESSRAKSLNIFCALSLILWAFVGRNIRGKNILIASADTIRASADSLIVSADILIVLTGVFNLLISNVVCLLEETG